MCCLSLAGRRSPASIRVSHGIPNRISVLANWRTLSAAEDRRRGRCSGAQRIANVAAHAIGDRRVAAVGLEALQVESEEFTPIQFLAPGILMMVVIQNAFANTSSSMIQSKITGNLVFLLIFGLVTAARGGVSAPPTTTPPVTEPRVTTTMPPPSTTQTSTNIPGGTLFMCSGDLISSDSAPLGTGTLTLQVYYSPVNGGRNCAVASRTFTSSQPGQMYTTLRFDSYDGRNWPRFAYHRSTAYAGRSGGVYLDDADGRCVRARVTFIPTDGSSQTIVNSGRVGCDTLSQEDEREEGSGPSGRRR